MALPRFFSRVLTAVGQALPADAEVLTRVLGSKVVGIRTPPDAEPASNAWWITELTTNLLARCYPTLAFIGTGALPAEMSTLAKRVNPAVDIVAQGDVPSSAIIVDAATTSDGPAHVFLSARGWVSEIAFTPINAAPSPCNPYASGVAACLGVAEVFRILFSGHLNDVRRQHRATRLSLLDFGVQAGENMALAPFDVGEVAFFGLGGVAQGALWALARHAGLRGTAHLVDHQCLDLSNLERYVLAFDEDEGRQKSTLAARAFDAGSMTVWPHAMSLEEFADRDAAGLRVPSVCVSVDNVDGRRFAQALLPRLLVNGYTSSIGLGASWHRFGLTEACLACQYHPDPNRPRPSTVDVMSAALKLPRERVRALVATGAPLSKEDWRQIMALHRLTPKAVRQLRGKPISAVFSGLVCGVGALTMGRDERIDAVPLAHQAALPGILMAAELLKRQVPELRHLAQSAIAIGWNDVLQPPPRDWIRPIGRASGCICSDPVYLEAYRRKWLDGSPTV